MILAGCWKDEQGRSLGAEGKTRREGGTHGGEEAQTPCEGGRGVQLWPQEGPGEQRRL